MSPSERLAPAAGLLAGALLALVPVPVAAQQPSAPEAAPVEVAAAATERLVPTTSLLGTTEPLRRSVVAAAIEGYVIGYPIQEGQWVEEGDVLCRLRDDTLELRLKEAEAKIEEIRARHRQARKDLERAERLLPQEAVTEKAYDAAVTAERTLALQIPQAEAAAKILRADIAKKRVEAPFDGQVIQEHSQLGQWVEQGGPVAVLVDISSLYVRVNVPERHVRHIGTDDEVGVRVAAARERPYTGRITSVSGSGDPDARTFPVRVRIPGEGGVRAGMTARVELPTGEPRDAIVMPRDALLIEAGRSFVFVVTEEGTAERRPVRTGIASGARIEVVEGLAEGERVVVRGNERIQPGAPVRVVGTQGASGAGPESAGEGETASQMARGGPGGDR